MPPTRAEIAAGLGFSTPSSAEDHLQALAKKGAIEIVAGRRTRIAAQGLARRADAGHAAAGRARRRRQPDPRGAAHRSALSGRSRAVRAARGLSAARARQQHEGRRHPGWRPARRAQDRRGAARPDRRRAPRRRSDGQALQAPGARYHAACPKTRISRRSSSIRASTPFAIEGIAVGLVRDGKRGDAVPAGAANVTKQRRTNVRFARRASPHFLDTEEERHGSSRFPPVTPASPPI